MYFDFHCFPNQEAWLHVQEQPAPSPVIMVQRQTDHILLCNRKPYENIMQYFGAKQLLQCEGLQGVVMPKKHSPICVIASVRVILNSTGFQELRLDICCACHSKMNISVFTLLQVSTQHFSRFYAKHYIWAMEEKCKNWHFTQRSDTCAMRCTAMRGYRLNHLRFNIHQNLAHFMGEEAISLSSVVSRWKQKGLGRKESEEENERNTALQSNCAQKGGTSEPILECKKKKKRKETRKRMYATQPFTCPQRARKNGKQATKKMNATQPFVCC